MSNDKDDIKDDIIEDILEEEKTGENSSRNILPPVRESGGLGGVISVRGLAEGAMMTALMLILAIISRYVPVLNILGLLLFPAPLALVVLRHGLKLGFLCAASVFLLTSMLLGLPQALYLFLQYGFLGLYFGFCFRQKIRAAYTLFGGVMISSVAMLFSFIFPSLIAGVSLEQYQTMMLTIINDYVAALQQSGNAELIMRGMTPAAFTAFMVDSFLRLLPSFLVVSAMSLTWLCYMLMCKLLRRFGYEVSKLPIFIMWRLDWRFLWALIIALALAGLGQRFGYDTIARIGDNLLMAFAPVLLICGLSVMVWLLKSWRVSLFVKMLIVIFVVQLLGFIFYLLILVGVFDPLFDFRRRITRMREKRQAG